MMEAIACRAVARGELPSARAGALLPELLVGAIFMRALVTGDPLDRALLDGLVAHVVRSLGRDAS